MNIEIIKTGRDHWNKFTVSPNNIRKEINQMALDRMIWSVATFGVINPISINSNYEVVSGQMRWLAAKKLDIELNWVMKDYKSDKYDIDICEMFDSATENDVRMDTDSRDLGKAIIFLHDEKGLTFEEIAEGMARDTSTAHKWYRQAMGPIPLQEVEIKQEIEEEKAEEEKKKKRKEKEKKSQPTIEHATEDIEKIQRENKIRREARALYDTFGLKTATAIRRIIESPQFKDDLPKCMTLLEYARDILPLRTLTNIYKDVKMGLPADLEYWKELHSSEITMLTARIRDILMEKIKPILKRRNMNLHHAIEEALVDWLRKWSLEEDWETDVRKEIPEAFK